MNTLLPDLIASADHKTIFDRQRQHAPVMALTTAKERIERLKRIQTWIATHDDTIKKALYDDFRKPASEAVLTELYGLNGEINHTINHLAQWMKPQRVPTPTNLIGMRSQVRYEPKGNVLVIAPWNYPFILCIKPLMSAIAAGNVVMVKPSELTPNTTRVIQQLVADLFPPEEVAVFAGDASVATALLELPFNHIFFTGSPAVGKIVMAAAAKNLTSVTLELGGKSPCIVDETADIQQAAEQLAWGKGVNNGQTCIAPDYLLIHESVKPQFVQAFRGALQTMYNPDGQGVQASDSYCRMVNRRHFERVRGLVDEAVRQGATVSVGGQMAEAENFIEPTLLENVTDGMRVMQDEIFGPVLPLQTYTDRDDAIQRIRQREKPLALYIHSRNRQNIRYFMDRTTAGDTVINDVMLQFNDPEMPFGGVNNSGIGKSNGYFSFQEYSNMRGTMERQFGTMKMLYPPYTNRIAGLLKFLVKYL